MRNRPEDLASGITTRKDMATFLDALSTDAVERASEWENLHIFDMLESMAAWLRDTTGHEGFRSRSFRPLTGGSSRSFYWRASTMSSRVVAPLR